MSVNDCIDAHRPFDYGKIDQASYLRFIRQSEGLSKERFRYCGFGLLGEHISEEEISFLKEETEDAKLNYIRTIRTTGTPEVSQEDENAPLTQAGREFIKSLANLEDSCDIIHLSISLESIHVFVVLPHFPSLFFQSRAHSVQVWAIRRWWKASQVKK